MQKPLLSKRIHYFRKLDSTNIFAEKWLVAKTPDQGDVILTDFQTNGSGVGKNTWDSEDNKNLLCSIFLYPDFLPANEQFILNEVASLSVANCVRHFTGTVSVKIKWPNDIYVGRKKIAGILSRNTIAGNFIKSSIIGIGLNVNQISFGKNLPNPVSLKQITGKPMNRRVILSYLLAKLEYYYGQLKNGNTKLIYHQYLESLLNYNIEAIYRADNRKFAGIIVGVTKYGHLRLMTDGIEKHFEMKEIRFVFN